MRRQIVVVAVAFFLSFAGRGASGDVQYTVSDLGTFPGVSYYNYGYRRASGINATGQVVGWSYTSGGADHAFLYSNGAMQDLGTLPDTLYNYSLDSYGYGINTSGQVVGCALSGSEQHVFLYTSGVMQDLGMLAGSWASVGNGINAAGQIVGDAAWGSSYHPFLYSDGTMTDLNSLIPSGWELDSAAAINDTRQIVGTGQNPWGQETCFLLTPATPTPEPSTFVLLAITAVGLFAWRRRRQAA